MEFNTQDFLTNSENLKHWKFDSNSDTLQAPMLIWDAGIYQYPLTFEMWILTPGTTSDILLEISSSFKLATDLS